MTNSTAFSTVVSTLNPTNWFSQTAQLSKKEQAINGATRFALAGLGAKSILDACNTAKTINVSKQDWQVKKIAETTIGFAAGALAFKAALSEIILK